MSALSEKQKRHLRGLGHKLKPVVTIGAHGYTAAVRSELEQSLVRHELLKVRLPAGERSARDAIITQLCTDNGAQLVQRIGNVALLYRRHPDKPRLVLPG
jgi:RNA-binding protein